ncbi:MAG: TetR/AcrR family transcriptional regulator [Polyangiaceae bacterium]
MNGASKPRLREEARSLYRNAILDAAEQIFAERGFHAARIQDIAERGGFAVGTVYKHFEQKEDVLRALMVERMDNMQAALEEREGDPPGFEDKLVVKLGRLFGYVEMHRAFYRIALENGLFGVVSTGSPLDEKDRVKLGAFKTRMADLIHEGIDEGILANAEPGLLSSLLFGTVRAFSMGAFELGESPEEKARLIVDLFMNGAKKRAGVDRVSGKRVVSGGKKEKHRERRNRK